MGRKSKKQLAEEKGIKDAITAIVNKINGVMETYGHIKDVIHVVRELTGDEELMGLIGKIKSGNNDARMYVLLTAAILRVLKNEMADGDGVFDYTPPGDEPTVDVPDTPSV